MEIGWAHLFDWSVASVSQPLEIYHHRHHCRIVAYQVTVWYNYHGQRVERFLVSDTELFISAQQHAYNQAMKFCEKMQARIQQRNK